MNVLPLLERQTVVNQVDLHDLAILPLLSQTCLHVRPVGPSVCQQAL